MEFFKWILVLLIAAVGLSALARRWRMPYPALLAALGVALVFMPGTPHFMFEPDLALALFVAPVLLDAAYDTSPRDLLGDWLPITGLVIVAVGITTVAVAFTVRWFVPEMPWSAAIALGAIVAPPDAAAATAVLKATRPPYRLLKILEGESLFNDASSLLIYRFAVAIAMGWEFSAGAAAPLLAYALIGSIVAGFLFAQVSRFTMRRIEDAPTSIVVQFVGVFGVWILAEHIGLSGILTIVVFAIIVARSSNMPARLRIPSYAVWETMVFVLNALAFVLIGLQLGPIIAGLSAQEQRSYGTIALAVLAVTIASRFVWIMGMKLFHQGKGFKSGILMSWCGMRGIVTLAAALALPEGFPQRPLILVVAFTVVIGTLLVQGLTLRPLLALLALGDDGPVDREADLARQAMLQSALLTIQGDSSAEAAALRVELAELWRDSPGATATSDATTRLAMLRAEANRASRAELRRLRASDTIGDDAYHRVEVELDRGDLYSDAVMARSSPA
ncbi:sodium:proton antiporter [soil metagenome]